MADMKALFIIVNAGFSEQIVEVTQELGAKGATIIPARGTGQKFVKVLGIHYEPEREILMIQPQNEEEEDNERKV